MISASLLLSSHSSLVVGIFLSVDQLGPGVETLPSSIWLVTIIFGGPLELSTTSISWASDAPQAAYATLLIGLMNPPCPKPFLLSPLSRGGPLVGDLLSLSLLLGLLSPFFFSLDGW